MKKYIRYEVKKNLWTLVVLTAILSLLYVSEVLTLPMIWKFTDEDGTLNQIIEPTASLFWYLTALCFVIPVLTFSFKMNKRSVDAYYALPLKKEKLYLAKTIIGLLLIVIPFTVSYWLGAIALSFREGNPYQMVWFIPGYFGGIVLAILAFGIHSFLFTRGNTVFDGVVIMLGFSVVGSLVYSYLDFISTYFDCLEELINVPNWVYNSFTSVGSFHIFSNAIDNLLTGDVPNWSVWSFVYPTIIGILGYVFLFYCLKFEKAENAEQISNNIVGYRTLIPLYLIFLGGMSMYSLIEFVIFLVLGIVATIVYQRKFRLGKKDWIRIAIGIIIGLILYLITEI